MTATNLKGKGNGIPTIINKTVLIALILIFQFTVHGSLFAQQPGSDSEKSSLVVSSLALAGTAIPIVVGFTEPSWVGEFLIAGGLVLGPVLGYGYMGHTQTGLRYARTRFFIVGATAGSILIICNVSDCDSGGFGNEGNREFKTAVTIGLVGVAVTTIHNIVDTFSIRRRSEAHTHQIAISPTFFPDTHTLGVRAFWIF